MKIAWATDVHLDHLNLVGVQAFIDSIDTAAPDAVVLTGDISIASCLQAHLHMLATSIQVPIYFVLGNHDYYGGAIEETRDIVREVCSHYGHLNYLTESGPLDLTPDTKIIGHDGWYDMRLGQINPIRFIMSDWELIGDYFGTINRNQVIDQERIITISRNLADEGVESVWEGLGETQGKNVVVLTHVPPFPETAKYRGKPSELIAQPVFTCKAMGDMLRIASETHGAHITVLAGHTHDPVNAQINDNLSVLVGAARYGRPKFQMLEM